MEKKSLTGPVITGSFEKRAPGVQMGTGEFNAGG